MPMITPTAFLNVAYPRQFFGHMKYTGDTLSWALADLFGTPDAEFSGMDKDPTGRFVMLGTVPVAVDSDPSQWTGTTTADRYGSREDGTKFLYHGDPTAPLDVTFIHARLQNEGFSARCYLGASQIVSGTDPTPVTAYLHFSEGHAAGTYGLRMPLEPGKPMRLQAALADDDGIDGEWTDVAIDETGVECEAYLDGTGRYLDIDVLPMTDPSWAAGLPASGRTSGPPPNMVVVTIGGGDLTLKFVTDALSAGKLRYRTTGRQASLELAKKRFQTTGACVTSPLVRGRAFQTDPQPYGKGYLPYADFGEVDGVITDVNAAFATLAIAVPDSGIDSTGYAVFTPFLSHLEIFFPPAWDPPSLYPDYLTYFPVAVQETLTYDQSTGMVRGAARCIFNDIDGEFAPGVVLQAVRGATLWRGWVDEFGNTSVYPGVTGYTALAPGDGQKWSYQGGLRFFEISIHDRMRRGDSDQISCDYLPAFDNQCHYYAIRQLMYKLGVTDEWMTGFPYCTRDSDCGHYHLPYGTTRNPLLQFHPSTPVVSALQVIRRLAAEFDPGSGQVQPMVLGFGAGGLVIYEPLPIGVVQSFLDSSQAQYLSVKQAFSKTPLLNADGTPMLNEFLDTLETTSDLSKIRTPVVFEGIDPSTGSAVIGVAYNELQGGGPFSDPDAPGNVDLDVPFIDINRIYSNPYVAGISAQLAAVQTAFPVVSARIKAFLQPNLYPLDIISAQESFTMGTDFPVAFYPTLISNTVDLMGPHWSATSQIYARLLGQAGD